MKETTKKILIGLSIGAGILGVSYLLFFRKKDEMEDNDIEQIIPNFKRYKQFSTDTVANARALEKEAFGEYKWSGSSGMPIDIYFKGENALFKKPADGSTYCTGYTFAVFFVTALNRGLLNDFTDSDIKKIQQVWNQGEAKNYPKLCVDAISNSINNNEPLGEEVSLNDAKSGDFCQIWRTNISGHSVILIDKVEKNGKIIGLKYYSSNGKRNPATNRTGAGEATEYYSDSGGTMLRNKTYFARLND
jgi:hypothetical protein